jgi:hypothetical protein
MNSVRLKQFAGRATSYFHRLCNSMPVLVVLYGCETWSPTLREEHRLKVIDNRVLRRIFGPKRD